MMRRPAAAAFFLLLCLPVKNAQPLSVGINFEQTTLIMPDNPYVPPVEREIEGSFFARYQAMGGFYLVNLAPRVNLRGNRLYFGFHEAELAFFLPHTAIAMGKHRYVFGGKGMSYNLFHPDLPLINPEQERFWQARVNIDAAGFDFTAGFMADTEAMDSYKEPEWYDVFFKSVYNNAALFAGVEADVLFESKTGGVSSVKTAVEASFLLPYDMNLYSVFSYNQSLKKKNALKERVSGLVGFNKYFALNGSLNLNTSVEAFHHKGSFGYAFYQGFEHSAFFMLTTGIKGHEAESLELLANLTVTLAEFTLEGRLTSGNLLGEDKKEGMQFFLGATYEF